MGFLTVSLLAAFVGLTSQSDAASPCSKVHSALDWVPDPDSCQKYYICAFRQAIQLNCGEGFVWQAEKRVCCVKGSPMDTCSDVDVAKTTTVTTPKIPERCVPGMTRKLAHSTHCARYHDCSQTGIVRGLGEQHVRECPYPELFNVKTGKCEDLDLVDCGERIKPKHACEYEMNKCQRSHCIPCYVRFPSCAGLKDGKQVWKGREKSPFYAECKRGRVVRHGRCPKGQLFHPKLLVCADAQTVASS